MENEEDVQQFNTEIESEAVKLSGWENLAILGVEKFGKELNVKTDKGDLFVSVRTIFDPALFKLKAFEDLNVYLEGPPRNIYARWLGTWLKNCRDLKATDADLVNAMEDWFLDYIKGANEEDLKYLDLGRPVILPDDTVAFRSGDFIQYLEKTYRFKPVSDHVYFVLRKVGCLAKQIGDRRTRSWVFRPKRD